jgi:cholesterol transport system auxiliary component
LPPAAAAALGACGFLNPTATPHPAFYSLDGAQAAASAAARRGADADRQSPRRRRLRQPAHRLRARGPPLEYFANSEWIDPPARMLAPLLPPRPGAAGPSARW